MIGRILCAVGWHKPGPRVFKHIPILRSHWEQCARCGAVRKVER